MSKNINSFTYIFKCTERNFETKFVKNYAEYLFNKLNSFVIFNLIKAV